MEKIDDPMKGGSAPSNPSTPMGWYYDLPGNGERVSLDFSGERDFVSWKTLRCLKKGRPMAVLGGQRLTRMPCALSPVVQSASRCYWGDEGAFITFV